MGALDLEQKHNTIDLAWLDMNRDADFVEMSRSLRFQSVLDIYHVWSKLFCFQVDTASGSRSLYSCAQGVSFVCRYYWSGCSCQASWSRDLPSHPLDLLSGMV